MTTKVTFLERFQARVDTSAGPDACWPWTSTRNGRGYGIALVQGPGDPSPVLQIKAHRMAYLIHYGPPPKDALVLHRCDNPPCCNPRHLYLGDHQQNMRDAVARGRQASVAKTHCPHGHPYDDGNTYIVPRTGHRQCRACRALWRDASARRYRARRDAA